MIYIHVPFCKSFCTYCDFYSEVCRDASSQQVQNFLESLRSEVVRRRGEISFHLSSSPVRTLYVGGGTPSVLPPASFGEILEMLSSCCEDACPASRPSGTGPARPFGDAGAAARPSGPEPARPFGDAGAASRPSGPEPARPTLAFDEFTVEVNPDDVTPDFAAGLRALGVNRISMGVQSLDDGILRWMNRRHTAGGASRAFSILREAGFDNISVDLIFGLSQSSDDVLCATLDELVSWGPAHISAYQLSIEEGSALGKMVLDGRYVEASQEMCSRQYSLICSRLASAGYHHYEISNWALPGWEAIHNSAYWARTPYAGLGPGAHSLSLSAKERSWNSQEPDRWKQEYETLSEEEVTEETIMLGLRRDIGLEESFLRAHVSSQALGCLLSNGSLEYLADGPVRRIRIPESRWFVSDDIISTIASR